MKFNTTLILAALLCGCAKHHQQWEYKIITVENAYHRLSVTASNERMSTTNDDKWIFDDRRARSDAGYFDIENGDTEGVNGHNFYGSKLAEMGANGWELVSAVPQLETSPDAEYLAGLDYENGNNGKEIYKPFTNIRTGNILLIFKRPQ
jgi:hypothetical protein